MNSLVARYQDWMSLKTNLLWIYEGEAAAGGGCAFFPEYFAAMLVTQGHLVMIQDTGTISADPGHWIIPWPGFRYHDFTPDARFLSVRFQAHWPDGRALFERGLGVSFASRKFPALETDARHLLETVRPLLPAHDPTMLANRAISSDEFFEVKIGLLKFIGSFVGALVGLGLKPTRLGTHDERILQALSRLDLLPLTQKLPEQELATEVGLGLSQFVRLFRANVGMTPKKYVETRRKETCKRLLTNTAIPLKQISLELGFSHHSDFSYWFNRNYKMSPKAYRLQYPHGSGI